MSEVLRYVFSVKRFEFIIVTLSKRESGNTHVITHKHITPLAIQKDALNAFYLTLERSGKQQVIQTITLLANSLRKYETQDVNVKDFSSGKYYKCNNNH